MEMQYFKEYSPELGRDMECKLYGHAGRPLPGPPHYQSVEICPGYLCQRPLYPR